MVKDDLDIEYKIRTELISTRKGINRVVQTIEIPQILVEGEAIDRTDESNELGDIKENTGRYLRERIAQITEKQRIYLSANAHLKSVEESVTFKIR